ncbi:hypothetical protein [Halomonas sp.]|uniref:hypothetical protein n=1 Tax=Halomonas sp. TaxID=1486246 RepID=UPI00356711EA
MQDTLPFIRPLVEKYDRPGPRYTSYTTASQFQAAVNRIQSEAQVVELGERRPSRDDCRRIEVHPVVIPLPPRGYDARARGSRGHRRGPGGSHARRRRGGGDILGHSAALT